LTLNEGNVMIGLRQLAKMRVGESDLQK